MACSTTFISYMETQLGNIDQLVVKPMFGEYGIWADGKFFGLICDDKLFIKPTVPGREFIGDVTEAPPYKGAKNYFLIEDKLDDKQWITKLVRITLERLVAPNVRKKSK